MVYQEPKRNGGCSTDMGLTLKLRERVTNCRGFVYLHGHYMYVYLKDMIEAYQSLKCNPT